MSGAKRNPESESPACESAGRGAGNKLLGRAEGGGLKFRPPAKSSELFGDELRTYKRSTQERCSNGVARSIGTLTGVPKTEGKFL